MKQGHYNGSRKSVDGDGSKPFVVAFYVEAYSQQWVLKADDDDD